MLTELLRVGGRVAAGLGAAGVAVVVVVAAGLVPSPDTATGAEGTVVEPVSVQQLRVCPGPLVAAPDGGTTLASFGIPGLATGTVAAPGAAFTGMASLDVPVARDGAGPFVLTAPSAAAPNELLAAAQAQAAAEDVAGLAATACTEGAAQSWILAGATDTGRTSLLLLANPSGVPASVDLAIYTPQGAGTVVETHLHAGVVVDVPIESLADGVYTATVTSSAPVLASARASTVAPPLEGDDEDEEESEDSESDDSEEELAKGGIGFDVVGPVTGNVSSVVGERIDLAWFVAAGPLTTPTAFTTVGAPAPRLAIVNQGGETASITIDSVFGPFTTEIAPGSSIGLDIAQETVHVLTSTVPVEASVSYAGDGALASYPVRPANPLATPLTVYR
ncbi:MAG TPA: DUF5719 family protein [Naasia sp.]